MKLQTTIKWLLSYSKIFVDKMIIKKRWGFGLGTLFSLIVVYFIYLYSKDKGWIVLASLSKWYLIVAGILIALPLMAVLLVILFSLLAFLLAMIKLKKSNKKQKNKYIDAEFRIKE